MGVAVGAASHPGRAAAVGVLGRLARQRVEDERHVEHEPHLRDSAALSATRASGAETCSWAMARAHPARKIGASCGAAHMQLLGGRQLARRCCTRCRSTMAGPARDRRLTVKWEKAKNWKLLRKPATAVPCVMAAHRIGSGAEAQGAPSTACCSCAVRIPGQGGSVSINSRMRGRKGFAEARHL